MSRWYNRAAAMIVPFLTEGFRVWGENGHPRLVDAMRSHYQRQADVYDQTAPDGDGLTPDLAAATQFRADHPTAEIILFIRPKAPSIPEVAARAFTVAQIEEGALTAPTVTDGRLRLPALRWNWLVSRAISAPSDEAEVWAQILLDDLRSFLTALRPSLVAFALDLPPFERAIAIAAQSLGIPTTTIQDGVFSSCLPPALLFGEASDHFIVWSEFSRRLLASADKLPADRIHPIGYPYPLRSLPPVGSTVRTVVFLGQNFETFSTELADAKRQIALTTQSICRELGLQFRYRAHPGETDAMLAEFMPRAAVLPRTESLTDLFARENCYLGITSTALIEAALYGRIALQVHDPIFNFDDLGALGAVYSCANAETEIRTLLTQVKRGERGPRPVIDDYLPIPADIADEFTAAYRAVIATGPAHPNETRPLDRAAATYVPDANPEHRRALLQSAQLHSLTVQRDAARQQLANLEGRLARDPYWRLRTNARRLGRRVLNRLRKGQ